MMMSNLTPEQNLAVETSGTNIIVSAGAGSGKTTVLKKRVERILLSGVNINNLIILTFTNNAAAEMKERIRKIINANPRLKDQAELLDSAYITTFDSFAQSLVKKYNYLLGINKNFTIVDDSIINLEINRIIDELFEQLYKEKDTDFLKLICDLEVKDDKRIRDALMLYSKNITNIIDRDKFLDTYISKFYDKEFIETSFLKYENIVFELRDKLIDLLENLKEEALKEDVISELETTILNLESASEYDELLDIDISIPAARKGWFTDNGKEIKTKVDLAKKELQGYLLESKKTLIKHYESTKCYAKVFSSLLKEIDRRIKQIKKEHNVFQFYDIAFLAIDLVKNYENVRNEIKYKTYEIMIDEYQDTNDIQEEFISYIANNNVYVVGDIKQSIYRFRNANPYIFKKRYDDYAKNINGFKIDLNKNFRSRNEVIEDINLIFNNIMYDSIGGADYKNQHQMIFGNEGYLDHIDNKSYRTEILSYDNENTIYKENEGEAFIIANDILNRIKREDKVTYIEEDKMKSRKCDFKDFSILVDKSKNFELLKKVLEFRGIPCTIYKDISINEEDEIYILKNLVSLIICIKEKNLGVEFKHAFVSIARSYVSELSDKEIFEIVTKESFKDTNIYKIAYDISLKIDSLSNRDTLELIVEKFEIINKLNVVGDVTERLCLLEYFMNNVNYLNNFGMSIYQIKNYFDELLSSKELIKMTTNKDASSNTVKIMTIHASKGLEYPFVYLPYLNSDIKKDPNVSRFKFSNTFGFIIPFYQSGTGNTFVSKTAKEEENRQALSEKIRLFYVAVTRAKEKLILINKFNKNISPETSLNEHCLLQLRTISDILTIIRYKINKYVRTINLDDEGITSDYNLIKLSNFKDRIPKVNERINLTSIKINSNLVDNKHFSKSLSRIVDRDLKERLDFGTFMHYVFEVYDFKNNNLDDLNISDIYKDKVRNFLRHDEVKNISKANCYKEHEVRFIDNGAIFHGFIDLLVEYKDHYDIIDYKLSNINSHEYVVQLTGYKNFVEKNYKKTCNIYLYSINKDVFKKID